MKRLYTAADLTEAYLVRDMLADAGIRSRILNEHAQGGIGEIPFTHAYPELWIERENDLERARKLVKEFEARVNSEVYVDCPRCGEENPENFETCWHCGLPLD
ncbi:MAG: hypothetical protein AMJ68_06420 [Acidithiobacillales bacterium SG8_45]|jgi:hypothetical protein|nr:MAG: hypothetical protein AMJ68_06420 [Acidithiobacillales bacterium SG8_45]